MQNIYRETFEQIHASEQLRKEVANVPKQEKAAFRHRISKAGLIAAALALALAGTVLAVASPTLWPSIPLTGCVRRSSLTPVGASMVGLGTAWTVSGSPGRAQPGCCWSSPPPSPLVTS